MLHPDALLDNAAVNRPAKGWQHAVDIDALQEAEAIGIDGPVPVLLSRKRLPLTVGRDEPLLEGGQQHHALDRRTQRGDQQAVVAARVHPGHRPRCVTAKAVRHQPLAAHGCLDVSTDLGIEVERHSG